MAATEEPILTRIERLDIILKQLEEIRGSNKSERSSFASTTPSSGTLTSSNNGRGSFNTDFSPDKHCRPMEAVIVETEVKGTLLERLVHVENQVLKLCMHIEEELAAVEKKAILPAEETHKKKKKKGLKQLVKSCVMGTNNTREP